MGEYCGKCRAWQILVMGVLILMNTWLNINWGLYVGALLILTGIIQIAKPSCGCGGYCYAPRMDAPVEKPKRRK